MSRCSRRSSRSFACFVAALLAPGAVLAEDPQGPRYTYVGAGYEWTDSKCGVTPQQRIEGYTVEGSVGILDFLHLIGEYSDSDTDFSDDRNNGAVKELDFTCYKIGAGLNYGVTDRIDLVLRGSYVDVEIDNPRRSGSRDEDGFEPEVMARIAASDKAEVYASFAYTDLGEDLNDGQIRIGLVYNLTSLIALRAGGVIFDDDAGFDAGVRVYFGDSLF